jgi:hypothetical protein
LNPLVTLVAADARIKNFRHPIPTEHAIREHAMLVTCAEFGGLISCLTRFVRFSPIRPSFKAKHQPSATSRRRQSRDRVPAARSAKSLPTSSAPTPATALRTKWKLHHQGGSCGYNPARPLGTPGNDTKIAQPGFRLEPRRSREPRAKTPSSSPTTALKS